MDFAEIKGIVAHIPNAHFVEFHSFLPTVNNQTNRELAALLEFYKCVLIGHSKTLNKGLKTETFSLRFETWVLRVRDSRPASSPRSSLEGQTREITSSDYSLNDSSCLFVNLEVKKRCSPNVTAPLTNTLLTFHLKELQRQRNIFWAIKRFKNFRSPY